MHQSLYLKLATSVLIFIGSFAQLLSGQIPKSDLNSRSENTLKRWQIQTGKHYPLLGTHIKPFSLTAQPEPGKLEDSLMTYLNSDKKYFSKADKYELRQVAGMNAPYWDSLGEWAGLRSKNKGLLSTFYQQRQFLYTYNNKDDNGKGIAFYINPVINFSGGNAFEDDELLFQNTRGVRVRGNIDNKIGFRFYLTENQIRYPSYVDQYNQENGVLPGLTYDKDFNGGYDFFDANGSINFPLSKHIQLEFGHGNHFIGQGRRSFLLSDFGPNYLFLRAQTQVGIFDYQNIFAELTGQDFSKEPYDKKYGAFHHLSIDILPNLQMGLFEGVIFHDNRGNGRGFELNYLNPVILYRSIDHNLGSPDNLLIGLDGDYIPFSGVQIYGQVIADEFSINEIRSGDGWWGNKFGWQLGGKYLDALGIKNLDLQLEYNAARPYLYSQKRSGLNYVHYNQPMAHPLGANFKEGLARIKYQPFPRWQAELTVAAANFGADTNGSNWGGNPRISYKERQQDYGNTIGQGVSSTLQWAEITVSFEPWPNLFLEAEGRLREVSSELKSIEQRNLYIGGGLKYNFPGKTRIY